MMLQQAPAVVVLRKDLARSIRQGHPWIYRDALAPGDTLDSGAPVELRTRDGRQLARGFWDARSAIALRLLEAGGPGHRFRPLEELVDERLRAALRRRLSRLDLSSTNAFRWLHGEADLLPGLHVDVYADTAVVRFDGEGARAFYEPLAPRLFTAAGETTLMLREVMDRDPGRAERKECVAGELEVLENGARFGVSPGVGQKGGLFLDQRENRLRVAALARGRTLLNLFGYTGGFSVHAALGGASHTDTVDLAAPAIEAARRNFERNGLPLTNAGFHVGDAFAFLEDAASRGQQWDIVVSDPPSFAPRRGAVPAASKAYQRLHRLAATVTRPGGLLCAASCSSHFGRDEFLASIEAGVRRAGRGWRLESLHGAAFDHPVLPAFPEGDYLKFAIGTVR